MRQRTELDTGEEQRPIGVLVESAVADAERADGLTVISARERSEPRSLRTAKLGLRLERQLERNLDTRRSIVGEEDLAEPAGWPARRSPRTPAFHRMAVGGSEQTFAQPHHRRVGGIGQDHVLKLRRL